MKRLFAIIALVFIGTSCTPKELAGWKQWYAQDPVAATEFANLPETQNNLHNDWDQDGVVEPDVIESDEPQAQERTEASSTRSVSNSRWDDIAWCESGGRWDYPPVTNRTGTYSGGLMIWTKAWVAYGGQEFAGQAWQASKAQQIVVAERILADNGWGAWDCA